MVWACLSHLSFQLRTDPQDGSTFPGTFREGPPRAPPRAEAPPPAPLTCKEMSLICTSSVLHLPKSLMSGVSATAGAAVSHSFILGADPRSPAQGLWTRKQPPLPEPWRWGEATPPGSTRRTPGVHTLLHARGSGMAPAAVPIPSRD